MVETLIALLMFIGIDLKEQVPYDTIGDCLKAKRFSEQEVKDVFLHVSALEEAGIDTLKEGEEIEFEIGENKGKENAINIKKIQ